MTKTSTTSSQHCCFRSVIEKNAAPIPRAIAILAVVCTVFSIILALARQFCHHAMLDSESNYTNRMCDQTVGYQLATLLPSPCNRKKRLT